ncbi:thiopeptide-type bacteriocin biosynthesis protein [Streptomyces xiaopingdaonensis]|uniref:thiopeptide-type bacteriocin biosynthesis protein n=1 Tax=Streptomyces xiaopingdaonensis TaxID=1565415 RepID=UPI00036B2A2F|nr:thiopeptide-type bacteriocin biosynthesis protein [Streptomyces xiaopingdaonensis]
MGVVAVLSVERLLADCVRDSRTLRLGTVPVSPAEPGYGEARRAFLSAGLAALRNEQYGARWVQLNLSPAPGRLPELYAALAASAHALLADGRARSFYFMHKEPGLRVRFEAGECSAAVLRKEVEERLPEGPLALQPVSVRYEPEAYLFGGPQSMPYVHRLFTADSLAWLDHHGRCPGPPALSTWRLSLLLLREAFDGLGIVGWEHRGVWEAIQHETGRTAASVPEADQERHGRALAGITAYWRLPRRQALAELPGEERTALEAQLDAAHEAGEEWRKGYFEAGSATVGPRLAAAFHTIFLWNRGRLALSTQRLLTEALAWDAPSGVPREGTAGSGGLR